MKTYGRTTIYANYTEKEILSASEERRQEIILDIINNSILLHNKNKIETKYLRDYFEGEQDIYVEKQKITRTEIDNRTVENWAYAFIDFKKCWLLGKPIQYVQIDDKSEEEVSLLNKFCRYENKKAKDLLLFEDVLVSGRGFRYNAPDEVNDEDEAPFEIINVDAENCEVVYSSQLGHEQLLSFIETSMNDIDTKDKTKEKYYSEYTVYLRNKKYVVSGKGSRLHILKSKTQPLIVEEHYITEYYLNKGRISLIEIGKDLFNDINYLESLDKDDMEQFVNAIMVFTNVEATKDDIEDIRKLGAVCIQSTDSKPAKIELLEQRLNANTTNTYHTRLLNALHQILGIPKAGDNGQVSYGDTGQARLTGQGYTSAGIRADGDETMFSMCDLQSMKSILKICKKKNSGITKLKVSDIDTKFQRDMSDNLLVKTQALLNLYDAKIPRQFANAIIGLFGDPNAVTNAQNELYGKETKEDYANKTNNNINEQENKFKQINSAMQQS